MVLRSLFGDVRRWLGVAKALAEQMRGPTFRSQKPTYLPGVRVSGVRIETPASEGRASWEIPRASWLEVSTFWGSLSLIKRPSLREHTRRAVSSTSECQICASNHTYMQKYTTIHTYIHIYKNRRRKQKLIHLSLVCNITNHKRFQVCSLYLFPQVAATYANMQQKRAGKPASGCSALSPPPPPREYEHS